MQCGMHWKSSSLETSGCIRKGSEMKFTVNNLEWEMKYEDADKVHLNSDDNTFLGLTEYIEQTISIRNGMSKQLTRTTVIHELCHCFLFSFGFNADSYSEEAMCNLFGSHADMILSLTDKFLKERGEKEC